MEGADEIVTYSCSSSAVAGLDEDMNEFSPLMRKAMYMCLDLQTIYHPLNQAF